MRKLIAKIHKKCPYLESIIMMFSGAFFKRFLDDFMNKFHSCHWYSIPSLYFFIITLSLLVIYYKFFSSFQIKKINDNELSEMLKESYARSTIKLIEKDGIDKKDRQEQKIKLEMLKEALNIYKK
jgi:ABC-type multidrug transport system fused ATPase/permease subunit